MARAPGTNSIGILVLFSIDLEFTFDSHWSCHKICCVTGYHFHDHTIEKSRPGTKTTFLIIPDKHKLIDVGFLEQSTGQDVTPQFHLDAIEFLNVVRQQRWIELGVLFNRKAQIIKIDITFGSR